MQPIEGKKLLGKKEEKKGGKVSKLREFVGRGIVVVQTTCFFLKNDLTKMSNKEQRGEYNRREENHSHYSC